MKQLRRIAALSLLVPCLGAALPVDVRDASQLSPTPGVAFFKNLDSKFQLPETITNLTGLAVVDGLGNMVAKGARASVNGSKVSLSARMKHGELLRAEWRTGGGQPTDGRLVFFPDSAGGLRFTNDFQRPGNYEVELLAKGTKNATATVTLGGDVFKGPLSHTAPDHSMVTRLGVVRIPAAGKSLVAVELEGGGEWQALTLRPSSEGSPIKQRPDGSILLHSRDVTSRGIKLQYEPKPEKITAGYWVTPSDTLSWDFEAAKPGGFDIEILQGCGKGQGGSEVEVRVLDSIEGTPLSSVRFTVQDTGHFQNFVPRVIGKVELPKAGRYKLVILPVKKAAAAVMDVRQVALSPASK